MIKTVNHKNVYFWSDLHLGHDRDFIWQARGFNSVLEHDETLITKLKELPEGSVLFSLGDIIFGHQCVERLEAVMSSLKVDEVVLLPGNHTSGFRQLLQKYGRKFVLAGKRVELLGNYEEITVAGQPIVLSHYPIISWNGMGRGSFHLFGHVHGRIPQGLRGGSGFGKMLDVGIESCSSPLAFDELAAIMDAKPFSQIDHH